MIDVLSKYVIRIPVTRKTDDETTLALEKAVERMKRLGYIVKLAQTDRENEFEKCLQRPGIQHIRSIGRHPQTNGLIERNNRFIK